MPNLRVTLLSFFVVCGATTSFAQVMIDPGSQSCAERRKNGTCLGPCSETKEGSSCPEGKFENSIVMFNVSPAQKSKIKDLLKSR